jgi:hypothetical protein
VITRDPLLHHELRSLMLEDCLHILRKGGRAHAYIRIYMSRLWERSGALLAFEGARERVGCLSLLQQQAHGAIDLQRHGEDKSEELNDRRRSLISRLHAGRNRSSSAVPKDDTAGHSGFPQASIHFTTSRESERPVIPPGRFLSV